MLLGVLLSGVALGQAEGEVQAIGFQGYYRPDCWTPMLIRLKSKTDTAVNLQIRVYQEDMDRDRVVAVKNISLTPSVDGRGGDQRFWMYFRPQPVDGGLSDPANGGDMKTLQQQLKVVLCDSAGRAISHLPITQTPRRVDAEPQSGRPVGTRMVLCVSDGMPQPTWHEYDTVEGLSATPMFISMRSLDLPEDVRGYEGVDAIVWLNATAPDPHKPAEELKYRAIEDFVRHGGMLVVCQGSEVSQIKGFEGILPVTEMQTRQTDELDPLPQLARFSSRPTTQPDVKYRVGFARARANAQVELKKRWDAGGDSPAVDAPYLARRTLGMGCVTWVAQDLSESSLARAVPSGWVYVWDTVLGWRNDPQRIRPNEQDMTAYSRSGSEVDVGAAVLRGQSMSLRVSAYVLLAVGFFAVYWVLAGPVLTMVLAARKLAALNWFAFGAIALAAAGLSLVVTRIIQSQSPKLDHITLVRVPSEGLVTVQSRIGLYVPSDGIKHLEISNFQPRTVNWITPFPIHPWTLAKKSGARFLAMKEYDLPIEDAATSAPVRLDMPWRSTQKQLETNWTGRLDCRIDGKPIFSSGVLPELSGVLTNQSGTDLKDVYIVYSAPTPAYIRDRDVPSMDRMVYVPRWPAGQSLELARLLDAKESLRIGRPDQPGTGVPGSDHVIVGLIEPAHGPAAVLRPREGWVNHWYSDGGLTGGIADIPGLNDAGAGYRTSLPLLSISSRIPPMRNTQLPTESGDGNRKRFKTDRVELLRLNGRAFDVSSAVAAGNMVVLAHSEGPMPVPLELDGNKIAGNGVVFYQFVLPLERK